MAKTLEDIIAEFQAQGKSDKDIIEAVDSLMGKKSKKATEKIKNLTPAPRPKSELLSVTNNELDLARKNAKALQEYDLVNDADKIKEMSSKYKVNPKLMKDVVTKSATTSITPIGLDEFDAFKQEEFMRKQPVSPELTKKIQRTAKAQQVAEGIPLTLPSNNAVITNTVPTKVMDVRQEIEAAKIKARREAATIIAEREARKNKLKNLRNLYKSLPKNEKVPAKQSLLSKLGDKANTFLNTTKTGKYIKTGGKALPFVAAATEFPTVIDSYREVMYPTNDEVSTPLTQDELLEKGLKAGGASLLIPGAIPSPVTTPLALLGGAASLVGEGLEKRNKSKRKEKEEYKSKFDELFTDKNFIIKTDNGDEIITKRKFNTESLKDPSAPKYIYEAPSGEIFNDSQVKDKEEFTDEQMEALGIQRSPSTESSLSEMVSINPNKPFLNRTPVEMLKELKQQPDIAQNYNIPTEQLEKDVMSGINRDEAVKKYFSNIPTDTATSTASSEEPSFEIDPKTVNSNPNANSTASNETPPKNDDDGDDGDLNKLISQIEGYTNSTQDRLAEAQKAANLNNMLAIGSKGINQIIAGIAGLGPKRALASVPDVSKEILQIADTPIENLKNSISLEDRDPNSLASATYRAVATPFFEKNGIKPESIKNMSAQQLEKILPQLRQYEQMKEIAEIRALQLKQENKDKLEQKKESDELKKMATYGRLEQQINTAFDRNTKDEQARIQAADRVNALIKQIKAGVLIDSSNIRNTLTNDVSILALPVGTRGTLSDREKTAINTLSTKLKDIATFIDNNPRKTIPDKFLKQLEVENNILKDKYVNAFKQKTNSLKAGVSADSPNAEIRKEILDNRINLFLEEQELEDTDKNKNNESIDVNSQKLSEKTLDKQLKAIDKRIEELQKKESGN